MIKINKIYLSKGDNLYNGNTTCDKFIGIEVDEGIYWIDTSLESTEDIYPILSYLYKREGEYSYTVPKITKLSKHHDDMFTNTKYIKNAIKTSDNKLWWKISELKTQYE